MNCNHCGHLLAHPSDRQKAAFKAICRELSDKVVWPPGSGHKLNALKWEQCMIIGWMQETDREHEFEVTLSPAGNGWITLFNRYAKMPHSEGSEILSFAMAFAAEHGII